MWWSRGRPARPGSVVAAALGLLGAILVVQGLWIPAKAALAQVLLRSAWEQTVTERASDPGEIHKPWPWADTWPVARLRVPAHGVDQIVLHGASGEALAFGPGRLEARPPQTPVVLAGHRDTHFAFLADLKPGDELRLDLILDPLPEDGGPAASRHYRVTDAFRVDHRDLDALRGDADDLVLVTCWPFDASTPGPWRWIVRARATGG